MQIKLRMEVKGIFLISFYLISLFRYMKNNNEPMSRRIIRPSDSKRKEVNKTADDIPKNHSQIPIGSHGGKILPPRKLDEIDPRNKSILNNERQKASQAFDKNLHLNRDTSDDNPLRRVSRHNKKKELKDFTHKNAL